MSIIPNFNFLKAKQNKKEKFRADNYEEINQSIILNDLYSRVYSLTIKNHTEVDFSFYSIQLHHGSQQKYFPVPAGQTKTLYATATSNLIGASWTNINFDYVPNDRNVTITLHWSTKDTAPTVPITMQNKNTKGKKTRSLEGLGKMVSLTYSGVHIDGSIVPEGGYTTTTAITGSVYLGYAVGYLSTYLSNGKEVLVPYYNKPG